MRLPVDGLFNQRMQAPVMRSVNGIQLLNLIRENGPISRAALARLSRLSKPTVSEQVNWLVQQGVVVELGQTAAARTGGKKPVLVDFNVDGGRVIGVRLAASRTTLCSSNLRGQVIARTEFETAPEQGSSRLLSLLQQAICDLKEQDRLLEPRLRVIAVGAPGRVDCDRGVVLETGNVFGWHGVDVRSALQRRFSVPVLVDNDVNVALVGELNRGMARGASNVVLISLDTGIGAAVAIQGRIHHGSHWAAGEISHFAHDVEDALRRPDPRGHLESVVGADQIAKRVKSAAHKSAALRSLLETHSPVQALFSAVGQGDTEAKAIADDLAGRLGVAVAQQVLAYDPDLVVLSGEVFKSVLARIQTFLSHTIPWPLNLCVSELGDEAMLAGAVDMALGFVYEDMARQLYADGEVFQVAKTRSAGA